MEGSNFTVKDIVIDTNKKLDKFIDKVDHKFEEVDRRFDRVEIKDAKLEGGLKTLQWIFGFLGVSGVAALVKIFIL